MDTVHADRLERARLALEGLSIGDSFGERFFGHTSEKLDWMIQARVHPEGVWHLSILRQGIRRTVFVML